VYAAETPACVRPFWRPAPHILGPAPIDSIMNFSQYLSCDATGLARLVALGETTPNELLDLALAQHRRVHPRINAICRLMEEPARSQLRDGVSGPLAGVPFLLKDTSQDYAGVPTSDGSRSRQNAVAREHAACVRRYRDAGLVIFGKTNLPEFALKAVTDPQLFGRTSNPWATARTPGGSSGGAAAAVASGIVPMAAAADGGGSIRIPAAWCGLFGLRPSRGRVSNGQGIGEVWNGASSEGVISRSVRDSALALDILSGPEPGDPFVIAPPPAPYTQLMLREPGRLRIGMSCASPIGTEIHPAARAAVDTAVRLLQGLGHEVEEAAPALDGAALAKSYVTMYLGQVDAAVTRARKAGARSRDFESLTRLVASLGRATGAGAYAAELARWNEYARALALFHQRFDLLLTPTTAHPPVLHGTGDLPLAQAFALDLLQGAGVLGALARLGAVSRLIDGIARNNLRYVPFTQLANLTGTPAMSVPLYWTDDALPMGVQFVAPFGGEDRLLQLAHQLEQMQPWFSRLPPWLLAEKDA